MTAVAPAPFQPWFRLDQGEELNKQLGYPAYSTEDTITASTTQTQAAAYALTAQLSRVTTVATGGNGVALPVALLGKDIMLINSGANAMQVFGNGTDTINGTAGSTGISQPASSAYEYTCTTAGAWIQNDAASGTFTGTFDGVVGGTTPAAGTFTNLKANTKLTYTGARVGTFTNNAATAVTTANTLVTANSMILISLNTPGGTSAGAPPNVTAITASTSFVTKGTASDTSIYNYAIIELA